MRLTLLGLVILIIFSCENNEEHVSSILYRENYDSLHIKSIGAIINGKKEGLWLHLNEKGVIIIEKVFINDSLNGDVRMYSDDASLFSEYKMKNNKLNGLSIMYYPNKKINAKGEYLNDSLIGIWEFYAENGKLARKILYKDNFDSVVFDNGLLPPLPPNFKSP